MTEIDAGDWKPLYSGVDAGRGSAIFLACQQENALLIMDDRAGRAEAKARKLKVIGTAAVVAWLNCKA
ncbi:MAG: hypothetical protein R3E95_03495 [Thiolinea sp.]